MADDLGAIARQGIPDPQDPIPEHEEWEEDGPIWTSDPISDTPVA